MKAKPKTKRRQLERALHKLVADFLDIALPDDAYWFPIPNGAKLHKATAMMLKGTKQIKAGVPDDCVIYRGAAYFIELKAPKGRASPAQWEAASEIARAGAHVAICTTVEQVRDALRSWGVPLRARV